MSAKSFETSWVKAAEKVPPLGHSVQYRTPTHFGLGYVDGTGRWMSFQGAVEPEPVLEWFDPLRRPKASSSARPQR